MYIYIYAYYFGDSSCQARLDFGLPEGFQLISDQRQLVSPILRVHSPSTGSPKASFSSSFQGFVVHLQEGTMEKYSHVSYSSLFLVGFSFSIFFSGLV